MATWTVHNVRGWFLVPQLPRHPHRLHHQHTRTRNLLASAKARVAGTNVGRSQAFANFVEVLLVVEHGIKVTLLMVVAVERDF